MRLVSYRPREDGHVRAGLYRNGLILDAAGLLAEPGPLDMLALLGQGAEKLLALQDAADRLSEGDLGPEFVTLAEQAEVLAPVPQPPSLRDFYAFEQHVAAGYRKRGRDVPKAWYEVPVFYYSHTGSLYGPDATIHYPRGSQELDFELELACVIGRAGRDILAGEAESYIAGYTILNDWSARDIQRQEMGVGLGPAKGKDFATSLGPYLVTPDELADVYEDGRHHLAMVARINGTEVSRGNADTLYFTFAQMIERASQTVTLQPGDVIGSGTVGTGCLLELGTEVHRWLQPGDVVELEIERLGALRNTIGEA